MLAFLSLVGSADFTRSAALSSKTLVVVNGGRLATTWVMEISSDSSHERPLLASQRPKGEGSVSVPLIASILRSEQIVFTGSRTLAGCVITPPLEPSPNMRTV